jgi:hypothetical protein
MRRRPHASDLIFGKRGSLVFAIRDAEPLSAALKKPTATSRLQAPSPSEYSLDKGKTIHCLALYSERGQAFQRSVSATTL